MVAGQTRRHRMSGVPVPHFEFVVYSVIGIGMAVCGIDVWRAVSLIRGEVWDMKEIADFSFEEAFAELEKTVTRLEHGDLSLEESIALFERGQALADRCNVQLDTSELRVRQLLPDSEGETGPYELEQD